MQIRLTLVVTSGIIVVERMAPQATAAVADTATGTTRVPPDAAACNRLDEVAPNVDPRGRVRATSTSTHRE